ncbi:MAG: L-aspartate oxidase [Candidatus Bathyarchaeota archaeon]
MQEVVKTDFLVIGSGIAGLSFAIEASESGQVTLITKKELMESNTNLAQGGIAAVINADDSFQSHIDDTLRIGCGLSRREAVETLVKNGPNAIRWLLSKGVDFDKKENELSLSLESGHSKKRIVHKGDYTGREIEEALIATVRRKGVKIYENCLGLDLIVKDEQSFGAQVLDLKKGEPMTFLSKVTILATGGIGQIYAQTSNPYIATGDGIAMAYRAGAKIQDMEFVQFHPTTIQGKGGQNFLISETLRGEGAVLRNSSGEAFMGRYNVAKELAPRDIVSRAVFEELKKGKVYLDFRHKNREFILERFPMIYKECLNRGIDITQDLIPIVPAAHYLCGGIKVGLNGESNIIGLFAFGECADTGVHGANRLASNSLLESVVFAILGVAKAKSYINRKFLSSIPEEISVELENRNIRRDEIQKELQELMWEYVGIMRRTGGLKLANLKLQDFEDEIEKTNKNQLHSSFVELQNMVTIAKLIAQAASIRKESRGTHFRCEYPKQDDKNWLKHIVFQGKNIDIS